ncbi:MAG TPA: hypothetical protein VMF35_11555, partial [Acidimicrobiales bacterium]|nr:hypothetical protein [Acidimicrobiales bacterium]
MTMDIEELEQRVALLSEAFETVQAIDDQRSGLTASSGRPAGGHAARMAARAGRAKPSPEQHSSGTGASSVALIAAASAAGVNPGDTVSDRETLARVTTDVLMGLDRNGAPSGDHPLSGGAIGHTTARARWSHLYPDERRLGMNDGYANAQKVAAVCAPEVVVASGGVCLPVNVDYSVPTWAGSDRP